MSRVTVLYVDDDPNLLEIGKIYLERMGKFKVDTALSAKDALEKLSLVPYDAIISDYEMPRMNGIEFLKVVRKGNHLLPFIIFTGRGREEIVIEAINCGANSYLQKGGDPEAQFTELIHRVRQAVQSSRADLALHESEDKLYKIFNSVNDAIHIHEIDKDGLPGSFIDVNEAACRMLQYERSELLTKMPLDLAVEKHSLPLDKIGDALKSKGSLIFETEHIRKDGTCVPVEISAHVTFMNGRDVVVSVIRDISERVREKKILHAELDLANTLRKARGLKETLETCLSFAIGASRLDSGEIYLVDPATGSLDLSISRNTNTDLRVSIAKYPAVKSFTALVTAGEPRYFAADHGGPVYPGGSAAPGIRAYAIVPIKYEDRPVGCLALSSRGNEEISSHARIVLETIATVIGIALEKARADEAGRANAARLETALEIGNLAWWEMELPRGTIRFDARKAAILGYSPDRFVHYSDFTTLLHPEDYERSVQAMRDHLSGEASRYQVDYRIRAADGDYHWFRDIGGVTRSGPDGAPQIVTGIVMDITAIKGMEAELDRMHEDLQAAFEQLTTTEEELQQNYAELEKSHTILSQSEARYRNLFEHMDEGLAVHELLMDKAGSVTDYRILAVNPSFERILGIPADSVIGKTGCEAYAASTSPYLEIYSRVATTHNPESFTTYFPLLDKHFRISVYSPKKGQFVTIFSDISKDVIREEELRKKNADLEAAYEEQAATEEKIRQNLEELGKSQQDLKKSEKKYRCIVETAREGIWAMDKDFRASFVNRQFAEFLGYPPDEMIGRDIHSFVIEEDRPDLRQKLAERKSGKIGSYEQRYLTRTGEIRWGLVSATPIFAADGTFKGSFAMVTDITAQKTTEFALKERNASLEAAYEELTATEEEIRQNLEELGKSQQDLKKSEEKYRRIVETTQEGIWILAPDHKITYVNARMAEMHGYAENEMLGRLVTDFVQPDNHPAPDTGLGGRHQGITGHRESRHIRKDGSTLWVQISSTPILGQDGKVCGAFAMLTDITERKRTEEILAESRRMIDTLIQNLPGMVYRCKNDPDWTMEFASGGCRDLTGYAPEELIANRVISYGALIVPEDREKVDRAVQDGVMNHRPFLVEYRIAARDGSIKTVWERGRGVFDEQGGFVALEGYLFDTTERWRADMALRQANRQLNLLSSITRHDILNNVTTIRSYLTLVEQSAHDPAEKAFLKKIESVTLSIRDQIDFTKVYKDLGTHEPQWQRLNKILGKLSVPDGVSLHNEAAGLVLYADPLLETVFYNLLDNTMRHAEKADRIRVACRKVPNGLVLSWEDNGAGIPDGDKEAIFDKGFGKNTGLGLFLVREILSITEITIRETGTHGFGACFELIVPDGAYRFEGDNRCAES